MWNVTTNVKVSSRQKKDGILVKGKLELEIRLKARAFRELFAFYFHIIYSWWDKNENSRRSEFYHRFVQRELLRRRENSLIIPEPYFVAYKASANLNGAT